MEIGAFPSGFFTKGATGFGAGLGKAFDTTGAVIAFFATGTGFTTGAGFETTGLADEDPAFGATCDFGALPALSTGFADTLETGLATGLTAGFTALAFSTTFALVTGFTGALALTTGFALETGFALLPLAAGFTTGFVLGDTLDLPALAFWAAIPGFLALAAVGLALGLDLEAEAGLLTVLAFAAVLGAAFLGDAPLEDFAFTGAGLVDLFF